MKNVFSGVFLDIFIQQILMIQDQQTQNKNQNRLNLLKKNNRNFIMQSFAIFVKKNYTMTIQQANALSQRPLSLYWKVSWCST